MSRVRTGAHHTTTPHPTAKPASSHSRPLSILRAPSPPSTRQVATGQAALRKWLWTSRYALQINSVIALLSVASTLLYVTQSYTQGDDDEAHLIYDNIEAVFVVVYVLDWLLFLCVTDHVIGYGMDPPHWPPTLHTRALLQTSP